MNRETVEVFIGLAATLTILAMMLGLFQVVLTIGPWRIGRWLTYLAVATIVVAIVGDVVREANPGRKS